MPLTLLHGPAGAHKSDFLIKKIIDSHLNRGFCSDFAVILPHRTALEAHQKKLISSLQESPLLMGEIYQTFSQFLLKILKWNLPRIHQASPRVSRLVLRHLLFTRDYPAFRESRPFPSCVQEILDSIIQLKQNGLDPPSFRKMIREECSEILGDFLQLFHDYNDQLGEQYYLDQGDLILQTLQLLKEKQMVLPAGLKSIFMDRFFPITLGQRELLKELLNFFPDLQIILSYSFDYQSGDDPYLYPAYAFLGELAQKNDYFHLTQSPPVSELFFFGNPADELEWIVDRIGQELSQGVSPLEIGVCIPSYPFYHRRLTELMRQKNILLDPPFLHPYSQFMHLNSETIAEAISLFKTDQGNGRAFLSASLTAQALGEEFEKEWEFETSLWLKGFNAKNLLKQWKEEEKSRIPLTSPHLHSGGVSVFGLDQSEGFEGKILFLAGFTDHFYPSPVRGPLFYTPEMLVSSELREILSGPVYRSSVEKHRLIHLVQRTEKKVIITSPQISWDGKEQSVSRFASVIFSEFLEECRDPMGGAGGRAPDDTQDEPRNNNDQRQNASRSEYQRETCRRQGLLGGIFQKIAFPKTRKNRFSVSELETYQKCPYQYYARYHLKLGELKEETFDPPPEVVGNLIHRTLQRLYSENRSLYQEAREYDLYLKRLQEKACNTVEEEIDRDPFFAKSPLPMRESLKIRFQKVISLFLENEIILLRNKKKTTGPHFFEWSFGNKNVPPLRIRGHSHDILVSGRIDRIDVNETLQTFTVIDYKSGSVDSSRQIRQGTSLQIPLYMMAVEDQGLKGYLPAGGWLVSFADLTKKSALFLHERGDEEMFGKNYLITNEEWEELKRIVQQKVVEISACINEGQFNPKPREPSLCWYCDYRAICHYQKGTSDG